MVVLGREEKKKRKKDPRRNSVFSFEIDPPSFAQLTLDLQFHSPAPLFKLCIEKNQIQKRQIDWAIDDEGALKTGKGMTGCFTKL